MITSKKLWVAFWKWLRTQHYDYNDWSLNYWLDDRMDQWLGFGVCPDCKMPGLKSAADRLHNYMTKKYDICVNCKKKFNVVNIDYKEEMMRDIGVGSLSRNEIRSLVEEFDITVSDVKPKWVKEVIKEFNTERKIAMDFAKRESKRKQTKKEVDRINFIKRVEKRLEDEKENE